MIIKNYPEKSLEYMKQCLSQNYIHVENDASYSFLKDENGILYIYFEWSNGKVDWLNNFNFPAKPYRDMNNLWFCHRGFLKVWKTLKEILKSEILKEDVKGIRIIGYSHGAAIALLCYEFCIFNRSDLYEANKIEGYGYGCPRVIWGFVNPKIKKRFNNFYIFRNSNDIVTHVPPVIFGFRHIGLLIKIGDRKKNKNSVKDHFPEEYIESLIINNEN